MVTKLILLNSFLLAAVGNEKKALRFSVKALFQPNNRGSFLTASYKSKWNVSSL